MWTCLWSSAEIEGTMVNAEIQNVTQNDGLSHLSLTFLQCGCIRISTSFISFRLTPIQWEL